MTEIAKGALDGECNRHSCTVIHATWYNPHTNAFYCGHCALMINRALRKAGLAECEQHEVVDVLGHKRDSGSIK